MSLLQENVYFSYRKVNKNAYFTLFEVNKNVNLVIFNMSKIACCRGATLVVQLDIPEEPECPESEGRRAKDHFCRGATGCWLAEHPKPESGDRSPKDGGRFLYRARRVSAES